MHEKHYLVPQHNEGFEKDVTHNISAKTIEDAEDWFVDAKERLLDINNWEKYAATSFVEFRLTDSHGKVVKRSARRGDHIRIDVPGVGNGTVGGFDWATIEAMEYDDYPDESKETFALRIRPSEHPQYKQGDAQALFPGNDSTSTFVVVRHGQKLHVTYHGRNELVHIGAGNNDTPGDAETPASGWLGLTDAQWVDLMKGLLK